MKVIQDRQLEICAAKSTILASIIAIITLGLGFIALIVSLCQLHQANQFQNQAAAQGVWQNYLATTADHREVIDQPYTGVFGQEPNDDYGWVAVNGLFTAETIYSAANGDIGWEKTAAGIVKDHREFVLDDPWRKAPEGGEPWFHCDYYSEEFISFMEDELDTSVCPRVPAIDKLE